MGNTRGIRHSEFLQEAGIAQLCGIALVCHERVLNDNAGHSVLARITNDAIVVSSAPVGISRARVAGRIILDNKATVVQAKLCKLRLNLRGESLGLIT